MIEATAPISTNAPTVFGSIRSANENGVAVAFTAINVRRRQRISPIRNASTATMVSTIYPAVAPLKKTSAPTTMQISAIEIVEVVSKRSIPTG